MRKRILRNPLKATLKENKKTLLGAMILGINCHVPFYSSTVYLCSLFEELNPKNHYSFAVNTIVMFGWTFFILMMGRVADEVGRKKLASSACLAMSFLLLPAFYIFTSFRGVFSFSFLQAVLILFGSAFLASSASLLPEIFPTNRRFVSLGLAITFGQAILGGTTPLICKKLVELTGSLASAGFYIVLSALSSYFALKYLASQKNLQSNEFPAFTKETQLAD